MPFSISSEATAGTSDARRPESETQSVFLEQVLKCTEFSVEKMNNADSVLADIF